MLSQAGAQFVEPSEIGNLTFWVDATDINANGTKPGDGASLSLWADKSGNGYDLMASGTQMPSYEAAGFDTLRPGVRFAIGEKMTGPDLFGGSSQEATIFFVTANVTLVPNFSLSLNGDDTGTSGANARYSFHTPWSNNRVYFDAGGCCGATRLEGAFPNSVTETSIYSALNDRPGNR